LSLSAKKKDKTETKSFVAKHKYNTAQVCLWSAAVAYAMHFLPK